MYVKIKLYTKFDAKMLIRSKVMIDLKKLANFVINAITQKLSTVLFFSLSSVLAIYFKYTHSGRWPNFRPTFIILDTYTDPHEPQSLTSVVLHILLNETHKI